jgi:8-oxo-dGTP pyrophosphatase MutT (NUDIX family)
MRKQRSSKYFGDQFDDWRHGPPMLTPSRYGSHIDQWNDEITALGIDVSTFEGLNDAHGYDILRGIVFPWAHTFRGGIILLHKDDEQIRADDPAQAWSMLMIHEKERRDGDTLILPRRCGFPKGSSGVDDRNILQTAMRELVEETGINLHAVGARLVGTPIILPRTEGGIDEEFTFFIAIVKERPPLTFGAGIDGGEWVNVASRLIKSTRPVSPSVRGRTPAHSTERPWRKSDAERLRPPDDSTAASPLPRPLARIVVETAGAEPASYPITTPTFMLVRCVAALLRDEIEWAHDGAVTPPPPSLPPLPLPPLPPSAPIPTQRRVCFDDLLHIAVPNSP